MNTHKKVFKTGVWEGGKKGLLKSEMKGLKLKKWKSKVLGCLPPQGNSLLPSLTESSLRGKLGHLHDLSQLPCVVGGLEAGGDSFPSGELSSWANRQIWDFFLKGSCCRVFQVQRQIISYPECLPMSSPSPCWPPESPAPLWSENIKARGYFLSFSERFEQCWLQIFKAKGIFLNVCL